MAIRSRLGAVAVAAALTFAPVEFAGASEGGGSLFVPGLNVPAGGVLPPPGVYFDNTLLLYRARQSASVGTPLGGNVAAGIRANIWGNFVTGLWVTPWEPFGGRLAFGLSVPFGEPDIRANAILSGPILTRRFGRPVGVSVSDATVNFGDPVVTAALGWSAGNWHWKVSAATSIPAGAYQPGELSNLAFNRWIGDFSAGITYLDPALGLDISTVAGFTVNGRNKDTDYRTGNEFHVDLAVSKNITKELSVGLIASHYQQIIGDSGSGATLGPYKGRTTAVGGTFGYTFLVGSTPVATRIKVLREVDTKNRPQGTIGWVQLSFPLWMPSR